jgi:hypothetical protein
MARHPSLLGRLKIRKMWGRRGIVARCPFSNNNGPKKVDPQSLRFKRLAIRKNLSNRRNRQSSSSASSHPQHIVYSEHSAVIHVRDVRGEAGGLRLVLIAD